MEPLRRTACRLHRSAPPLPIVRCMHWLSTTVQLVGTLVTAYGLFYAYGRATRMPARLRQWWDRVRHKRRDAHVQVPAMLSSTGTLDADVRTDFKLGENATTDEKLAQLETNVRQLRAMFTPINFAIERLDKAIQKAKEYANTAADEALAKAKTELQQFRDELKALQAVDLSIAGSGALIMALGYALSYFSCFRFYAPCRDESRSTRSPTPTGRFTSAWTSRGRCCTWAARARTSRSPLTLDSDRNGSI